MKRILVVLLTLSLLSGMLITSASAAKANGKCGDNLYWEIDGNDLRIYGTGPMYDYSEENPAPWDEYKAIRLHVTVEDGVTSIGSYAFANFGRAGTVLVYANLEKIGSKAFYNLKGNVTFTSPEPEIHPDAFSGAVLNVHTVYDWDESVMQNYGGTLTWSRENLILSEGMSKRLFGLNEEIKPEDLVFRLELDTYDYYDITPRELVIGAYDNSTYGEKIVTITADEQTFAYTYFVTDGTNHLDLITVEFPPFNEYNGSVQVYNPIVKIGSVLLYLGGDYDLEYTPSSTPGTDSRVRVIGKGVCAGFEKVFYFPILRKDISNATVDTDDVKFVGLPVATDVTAISKTHLTEDEDFVVLYENNINLGTATAVLVGIENCYGVARKDFNIYAKNSSLTLPGTYIGKVGDALSDEITIAEAFLTPAELTVYVDETRLHMAYYALYRVDGEEMTLIDEKESVVGRGNQTYYTYDFSSVYEDGIAEGGQIFVLSYTWVTDNKYVYAGAAILYVPAKVPQATSMTMYRVENDGDFRKDYLNLTGDDGALNDIIWTSSDNAVATVENGVVTFKKPGNVTVTGRSGQLQEAYRFTVEGLDITEGFIFDYSQENGNARVIYDNRLLEEGVDYTLSVKNKTLTVTGRGLFTGELEKTFVNVDDLADPHTHGFDNGCDQTCNSCGYTRNTGHKYTEQWSKDQTHHWHACTGCGEKAEYAAHVFNPAKPSVCTVCGPMYTAGDLNGDSAVNEDDAIYLLQHVLLPDFFPIAQDADYNGDSRINEDDAIYLLQHVLLPEFFPL